MKLFSKLFISAIAAAGVLAMVSCTEEQEPIGGGSSTESFFFQQTLNYNLLTNPAINIPVVRLGNSGDLTVNVTSSGDPEFTVPSSVTILDGDRTGYLAVTYNQASLQYNKLYNLAIKISGFSSPYGYEEANVTIEWPTSFFSYGTGGIEEGWWGEFEEKELFVRDYANNVFQCYLPECWGHDSGGKEAGYPVQDYVFYWNTATNMIYVPLQAMGCDDWCIADKGSLACKFGGPDYAEGSAEWMDYIDNFYKQNADFVHPYFDPENKTFYLSNSAAVSPSTGEIVYGDAVFDKYTLD